MRFGDCYQFLIFLFHFAGWLVGWLVSLITDGFLSPTPTSVMAQEEERKKILACSRVKGFS